MRGLRLREPETGVLRVWVSDTGWMKPENVWKCA